MDLAATLLAKETATASVDALVAVMRVRDDAPELFSLTRPKVFVRFFLDFTRLHCLPRLLSFLLVARARARLADDLKNSVSGF